MKSGRVKLVLRAQISLRSKMRRSCMRFLHVNKIPILIYTHTDEHRYYKRLNNREHYKSKTICLPPIYSLCTYLQHAHTRTRTHTPTHPLGVLSCRPLCGLQFMALDYPLWCCKTFLIVQINIS